jgi:hypothetical protein
MAGPNLDTPTGRKLGGLRGNELPNTLNPGSTWADVNAANAPYNHDANDVTGFVGVNVEYRTYQGPSASNAGKPFPTGAHSLGEGDDQLGASLENPSVVQEAAVEEEPKEEPKAKDELPIDDGKKTQPKK